MLGAVLEEGDGQGERMNKGVGCESAGWVGQRERPGHCPNLHRGGGDVGHLPGVWALVLLTGRGYQWPGPGYRVAVQGMQGPGRSQIKVIPAASGYGGRETRRPPAGSQRR